ncbi:MAG TPA: cobyrinate a,c-diamide synthase [Desulfuromonadales bacterium]|nr:cobyrinate a,c-diamide synthase [Desulfuromonadales bacterium]
MNRRGFLIAAPQSGSGKTTVSLAIMAALARRGLHVAPFKCGPDFIDPGYHRAVTGNASINLDGWMCGEGFVLTSFQTGLTSLTSPIGQTIAVIEGAMGLFDGLGVSSREGSSAQIAAITGAPVVLVVNARGMAASAAALVKGFAGFDPQVRLAGVIFNNVGSDSHAALLRGVMSEHLPEVALLGCVPRDESLVIPSRHLGLTTVEDNPLSDEFIGQLADMAERCLDLDRLSHLDFGSLRHRSVQAAQPTDVSGVMSDNRLVRGAEPIRIAVARDAAFCFMYEDNLRLLRESGAEPVFFSPLVDTALPPDISGIYLPGGYPELYAGQLAANAGMLQALREAVQADMPVYAECGGFVYLTQGIDSCGSQPSADFVGIFPARSRMLPRRKALGYRQVEVTQATAIAAAGAVVRGHEFHYSEIGAMPEEVERCYQVSRRGEVLCTEGYRVRNCLGSYIHLHFGSNPGIAATFVTACRICTTLTAYSC